MFGFELLSTLKLEAYDVTSRPLLLEVYMYVIWVNVFKMILF